MSGNNIINDMNMKYACSICGYVYDDEQQKVPFAELPEDWKCPLCGAAKSDFVAQVPVTDEPVSKAVKVTETVPPQETEDDMQKLSAGQLAALCSNLARGCEKQYKQVESDLFKKLAAYFEGVTPAVNDATVEMVEAMLKDEIAGYPNMNATAKGEGDRGAQRVCVWGEKVTRMLSSLIGRYLKEGEAMLADNEVWLCTVCGFVYVGKEAPQICPVCKVPSWKFEKM